MSAPAPSFVEAARREKLKELRQRGIAPFAYRYDRTHTAAQALAALAPEREAVVSVAGRLVSEFPTVSLFNYGRNGARVTSLRRQLASAALWRSWLGWSAHPASVRGLRGEESRPHRSGIRPAAGGWGPDPVILPHARLVLSKPESTQLGPRLN